MKVDGWIVDVHNGDVYAKIGEEEVMIGEASNITVDYHGSARFDCHLKHNKKCPVVFQYRPRRKKK